MTRREFQLYAQGLIIGMGIGFVSSEFWVGLITCLVIAALMEIAMVLEQTR